MEPSYPTDANQMPNSPSGDGSRPPEKRWPLSRKMTMLIAGAIIVVLLIVVAVVLNKGSTSSNNKKSGNSSSSLYIKQPGYENENDAIGDALALISKPDGKVVQYGGANVVQACALITLKDVRDNGLRTLANSLPNSIRAVYFDGKGPAPFPSIKDSFLPFPDDSNSCSYFLEDKGFVEVTVYQPQYVGAKAIDYELSRNFNPIADTQGLKTWAHKPTDNPDEATFLVNANGFFGQISMRTADKAARDNLLTTFADKLKRAETEPTPFEKFVYSSQIFEGSVANPCELTDNESFKSVLGVDSGPLVELSLASAVGVISETRQSENKYNYVNVECKRRSPEGSTQDKTLRIKMETYETADGAKALFGFSKVSPFTKNLQEIPDIGDEAYFADTAGMQDAFVFRKGRVIVSLGYFLPQGNDALTAAQRIQALTPLATSLVNDKLKDF